MQVGDCQSGTKHGHPAWLYTAKTCNNTNVRSLFVIPDLTNWFLVCSAFCLTSRFIFVPFYVSVILEAYYCRLRFSQAKFVYTVYILRCFLHLRPHYFMLLGRWCLHDNCARRAWKHDGGIAAQFKNRCSVLFYAFFRQVPLVHNCTHDCSQASLESRCREGRPKPPWQSLRPKAWPLWTSSKIKYKKERRKGASQKLVHSLYKDLKKIYNYIYYIYTMLD